MSERGLIVSDFYFSLGAATWGPWSFSLGKGGIVGLVGPNGAGKSTFFQVLLGEKLAVRGQAAFLGRDLTRLGHRERRGFIAMVPQESPYPPDWTVEAAVSLAFAQFGGLVPRMTAEQKQERDESLERFSLSRIKNTRLGELSSGQRQRVFLCRSLLQKAKLLLLDEPTNHLDPPTRDSFWEFLGELSRKEDSPTILMATHDLEFLKRRADQVLGVSSTREVSYAGVSAGFWNALNLEKTFGRALTVLG